MSRRILVVDDLAITRQILSRGLSTDYFILEASNGKEAKEVLRVYSRSISAVLLDIIMPEMDGYELLKYIKSTPTLSLIPVIIVTGTNDTDARVKALALGANDFVSKPYNLEIIKHCLRNNIKLRESASVINAIRNDKLTGLYNRETFFDCAAKLIKGHEPEHFILTSFDIDNFKLVNNQFGSSEGDRLLKYIGTKLNDAFESINGVCCRVAGDNFAGLYPNTLEALDAMSRLRGGGLIPENTAARISFSVGRYIVADRALPVSAMYDRAYLAKQSIKGRFDEHTAYFDDSMFEKLIRAQEIVSQMESALERRRFELWFQPQFDYASGAMIGAEALVRWNHETRGIIDPNAFIPVFEQNGLIYELDKVVWETACRQLRDWMDRGITPLPVSVNISRLDIFKPDIIEVLSGLVKKYSLPEGMLRLEIAEAAFAQSPEQIITVVKRLINRGFIVEIDGFGSGYSSLNTLKDVPAQVLKLDMRFLDNGGDARRSGSIIQSVVQMAKGLDMSVIAEGVETETQADFLKSIGCSLVQGYLCARPMPAPEYEALSAGASENSAGGSAGRQ